MQKNSPDWGAGAGNSSYIQNTTIVIIESLSERRGRWLRFRCLSHSSKGKSLALMMTPEGYIRAKCHAGCHSRDALAAYGIGANIERSLKSKTVVTNPVDHSWIVERIWRGCMPVEEGDPAHRYLTATRRLALQAFPKDLRYHANCRLYNEPFGKYDFANHPAMVCAIRSLAGKLVGVHQTFLNANGSNLRNEAGDKVKRIKSIFDRAIMGASIQLFAPTQVLGIAEGIETALAAHLRWNIPVWSTISASGMENVLIPVSVRTVYIFADNDSHKLSTGEKAACSLARRLIAEDRFVQIIRAKEPGRDVADLVQ